MGSAIYAAAAAGVGDLFQTVEAMGDRRCRVFKPDPKHQITYDRLYREYKRLHDYFGRGENPVMEHLRIMAREANEK